MVAGHLEESGPAAITIDRKQRDAIYQEILTELTGSGDIWAELHAGDYDAARPNARPPDGRHAPAGRPRLGARRNAAEAATAVPIEIAVGVSSM
jgi:hypothetical protein